MLTLGLSGGGRHVPQRGRRRGSLPARGGGRGLGGRFLPATLRAPRCGRFGRRPRRRAGPLRRRRFSVQGLHAPAQRRQPRAPLEQHRRRHAGRQSEGPVRRTEERPLTGDRQPVEVGRHAPQVLDHQRGCEQRLDPAASALHVIREHLAAGHVDREAGVTVRRPRQEQPGHPHAGLAQRIEQRPAVRFRRHGQATGVLRQGGAERQLVAVVAVQVGGQTTAAGEAGGDRRRLVVDLLQGRHGGAQMRSLGLRGRQLAGELAASGFGARQLAGAFALRLGRLVQRGGGGLQRGFGRALGRRRLFGRRPRPLHLAGQLGHAAAEAAEVGLQRRPALRQTGRAHLRRLALRRQPRRLRPGARPRVRLAAPSRSAVAACAASAFSRAA